MESVLETLARSLESALERGRASGRGAPFALVGIGGTAATGKTTLARALAAALSRRDGPAVSIVSTDGYMMERKERRRRGITGPNPEANDLPRLARDLERIARGEPARTLVRVETEQGRKSVERPFASAPLVLVEGLVALYPELGARYDLTLHLDGPPRDELAVRLERDVKERAHPLQEVEEVFWLRQREYDRYLRPTGERASFRLWASREAGRYELSFLTPPSC